MTTHHKTTIHDDTITHDNVPEIYVVATPIGNMQDITLRAIETLKTVDLIAAEDTRHTKLLLNNFGIIKKLTSLHQHNEMHKRHKIIDFVLCGKKVAIVSNAGTPLISDPGYLLIAAAKEQNIKVTTIPGACAAIAALSISGLTTDRFVFEGFLPRPKSKRIKILQELKNENKTIVLYESANRLKSLIDILCETFEQERLICIARELTKKFEQTITTTIVNVKEIIEEKLPLKGEIIVIINKHMQNKIF